MASKTKAAQVVKRGRGRPPVYAQAIDSTRVKDGWVDLNSQQNRTAPSGYRARYPQHDFRVIPASEDGAPKPFVLQVRRLRAAEVAAREEKAAE